jgi:HEAT repeat protein
VPILPSAGKRIHELLERLSSTAAAERESAVARLTLLGPRTLSHLPGFLARASHAGRLGALEVLERLGEGTGLGAILALTRDRHEDVARRAIEMAAAFPEPRTAAALTAVLASGSPGLRQAAARSLSRLHGLGLVEAVEPLLKVLFDGAEDESLRMEALEALSAIERRTLVPALKRLTGDRSPAVVRAAQALASRLGRAGAPPKEGTTVAPLETLVARLTSARTPSAEVPSLVAALVKRRSPALVPLLRRHLDEVGANAASTGAEAVARAKARVHLALGALDSRIALHDLRDLLRARPLYAAADLLAAAERVGDASLVPALAALAVDDGRFAEPVGNAFRAIVRREKLRRSSRVVKALRPGQRAALERHWPGSATAGTRGGRSRESD